MSYLRMVIKYWLLYATLIASFPLYIVPYAGEVGFGISNEWSRIVYGAGLLAFIVLLAPNRIGKVSDFLIHLHIALPLIPMLAIYAVADGDADYLTIAVAAFAAFTFLAQRPHKPRFGGWISEGSVASTALGLVIGYLILVIAFGGLRFLNFSLVDVYEFRDQAAEALPAIFDRFSPIVANCLLPLLTAICITRRNFVLVSLCVVLGFFVFALTSHKSPLFAPLLVIASYFVLKTKRPLNFLINSQIVCIVGVLVAIRYFEQAQLVASIVIRRVYLVPAHLNFLYYKYFSEHPFVVWSNIKIIGSRTPVYDAPIPRIIGATYINPEAHANSGWLAFGYAHLGVMGLFIYAVILAWLVRIASGLGDKIGVPLASAALLMPFFIVFTASDLPTTLLTHGLAITLLVLLGMRKQDNLVSWSASRGVGVA